MADNKKFLIGSRGSKLSLAYSGHVKDLLLKSSSQFDDNSIEIKIIKTSGDIFKNRLSCSFFKRFTFKNDRRIMC